MLLPTYQSLITNYPGNQYSSAQVIELIKGNVQINSHSFDNTCAMRMSRAFNYANSGSLYAVPNSYPGMLTLEGADTLNYATNIGEFDNFLTRNYSKPTLVLTRGQNGEFDLDPLKGKSGIIRFEVSGWNDASGHITLWDGGSCAYNGDHDYFALKQTSSISFWKC